MTHASSQVPRSALSARLDSWLALVTEPLAALAVVAEIVILLTGVISRFVFNHPLTWSDELATITFLWLAMLGSVMALRRGQHMRMTAVLERFGGANRGVVEAIGSVAPALFLAFVLWPSVEFAQDQSFVRTPALDLNDALRASALPVGVALMLAASLIRCLNHGLRDVVLALVVLAAIAVALYLCTPAMQAMGNWNLVVFFLAMLGAGVLVGVPIAFSFGLCTVAYLLVTGDGPLEVIPGRIDEGVSSLILLAVPLFILLGYLIVMTRMATAMVNFLAALVGHVEGGLAYVLLGAMLLVSGISGAKTADMAAVAPVLFPDMKKRGIHEGELVSLLAASGAMAETIPPSIVLIIIGSVTGVSIAALFTGGILPGVVLALALAIIARRRMAEGASVDRGVATAHEIGRTFVVALPALLLPVLIRVVGYVRRRHRDRGRHDRHRLCDPRRARHLPVLRLEAGLSRACWHVFTRRRDPLHHRRRDSDVVGLDPVELLPRARERPGACAGRSLRLSGGLHRPVHRSWQRPGRHSRDGAVRAVAVPGGEAPRRA